MAKPVPEGYQSLTPMFTFKDCRPAIEFYQKAFGAEARSIMPCPGGKGILHAELTLGNSLIMMGDENPRQPSPNETASGSSSLSFYLYVEDVDAVFARAVAAGATVDMPVEEMFWGDRVGGVRDPFGHTWMLATRQKEMTEEEMAKAAETACLPTGA